MGDNLFTIFIGGLALVLLVWNLFDDLKKSRGWQKSIKIALGLAILFIAFPIVGYQFLNERNIVNSKPRSSASHQLSLAIREFDLQLLRLREDIALSEQGQVQPPQELLFLNNLINDAEKSQLFTDNFVFAAQIFMRSQNNLIRSLNDKTTEELGAVPGGLKMYRSVLQAVRMHAMIEKLYLDNRIDVDEAALRHAAANAIETGALLSGMLDVELNFGLEPRANSEAPPADGEFFCAGYNGAVAFENPEKFGKFVDRYREKSFPIVFQDGHYDALSKDFAMFTRFSTASITAFFGEKEADRFLAGALVRKYIESAAYMHAQFSRPLKEDLERTHAYFLEANSRIDQIDAPDGAFDGWSDLYSNIFLNIGELNKMVKIFYQRFEKNCA